MGPSFNIADKGRNISRLSKIKTMPDDETPLSEEIGEDLAANEAEKRHLEEAKRHAEEAERERKEARKE